MKKSEIIYKVFSENLHNVCKVLKFKFDEEYRDEGYICPLSFKIHSRTGLSNEYDDQLTIEHIPPESLNGKGLCLTNKISNSQAGHSLDLALQNHINQREFNERISSLKTKVYIENVKMTGELDFTDKNNPKFNFSTKKWHEGNKRAVNKINEEGKFKVRFSFLKDNWKTQVSFLRTAYLFAFSHLGYSLLFGATKVVNPNYDLIRQQVLAPEKKIVNDIIILNKDLEGISLGVNIVHEPYECRSLLVVFELETVNKKWRYGVFLPGPDDYGFKAIEKIKENFENNLKFNFKFTHIPKLDIKSLSDSQFYYNSWEKINGFYNE
ncbi:hypothetical protein [Marinifilum fragile]|uniref:hypothetical protein n=1 Tax=Marinifilum fragile TaxID=570161 RepID=UPI002AA9375F|nr:hypothetical protein [Marinifilum fragile]